MRTFAEISNEQLLIEVIRRLRTTKVLSRGRSAPVGTGVEKVLQALLETGLMSPSDMKQTLKNLLESAEIVLTGHSYFKTAPNVRLTNHKRGAVSRLHPDAKISNWQYFTESVTPIVAKYSGSRRIYPNENTSCWTLILDRLYVVSDGLPASIQAIQKRDPAQPY